MGKQKLRKIMVGGTEFRWRFDPRYRATGSPSDPYECYDTFTAYLAGCKSSPLHVHFTTWESPIVGGPLRYGGPLLLNGPDSGINLHTPKWAAILIRAAMEKGWTPELPSHPLNVEDGISWLKEMGYSTGEDVGGLTSAAPDTPPARG